MIAPNYDVIVVGAGAAGITAAVGLARAGLRVAVVEAAAYPGAENWSGCVYFCENLAHPDVLGPDGVEALAWERRLVERGFFASDGHSLLGMTYRDPSAFRHCYTVLRPIFDHHLGQVALRHGVALLNETTAESLVREGGRVVGVCTQRGALYADLVFLAEGDASHLVTREGYERFTDQRQTPKFLQGIKQVIELPPGAVEEVFGVGPEEGVAYEMLVRNGTLRGKPVHLNMGGFLYTNRHSLSLGLVLPAEHLNAHFGGDPNLLMEWFEGLPALRPWLRDGRRGVFGAKLIRGGGVKDIPNLIDDGLAIGGAASAVGVDFPYPNFTGPATAMGLLLAQAVARIRAEGGHFSRDDLRRHYLEPLQRTHYWKDVEFLRRWPGYVKRTQVFFDRNIDLALGTAYVWTRPRRWLLTKWTNWLRLVLDVAGPGHWREIQADLRHLIRALRLRQVISRPALGRLLLDGTLNAVRDLVRQPRANLPAAGTVRLHYRVGGDDEPTGRPPRLLERWFERFGLVLASAARQVYTNDDTPLAVKLPGAVQVMMKQVNLVELLAGTGLAVAAALCGGVQAGWDRLLGLLPWRRPGKPPRGLYPRYAYAARQAGDLTPAVLPARQHWEARLARLAYDTAKESHIHVLWPRELQHRNAVAQNDLWHVCPAHVYEARTAPDGHVQVIVNFENCIKCETCWRTSGLVDWGRDGRQRFLYPVTSPAVERLLVAQQDAALSRPALPYRNDPWQEAVADLERRLAADRPQRLNGQDHADISELSGLLRKLEYKIEEFDAALAREPRTVDRARSEYLEMLARYALQLAVRCVEILRSSPWAASPHAGLVAAHQRLLDLATALAAKAEERGRRTWEQHFAWAAADGRQLRDHHVTGLRRFLDVLRKQVTGPAPESDPSRHWLRAEENAQTVAEKLAESRARLDAAFEPSSWRDAERGLPLTSDQDAVVRDLVGQVPPLDPHDLASSLHPPLRKALLAELGRRDPSLAYRVACHLWARDLARLSGGAPALAGAAARWARGEEWACFTSAEAVPMSPGGWKGEVLYVPAVGARSLLLLVGDQLVLVPADAPGLRVEPLATLGLRGAGLAVVYLDGLELPATRTGADQDRILRVWQVLSAADLTSIAFGMADVLCRRAVAHATGRVQFPGLFHDEAARDTIGKFGAVKKMVAEMAARRYLLETLDHTLTPADFSSSSVERAGLVKALAAEALGTAPGSLAYNAGQVFGGTGYSEDDILAKFYRDAAAWRHLGLSNVEVYRRHGDRLLHEWRPDGRRLAGLPDEAELFDQLAQRKALQAELDEVRVIRSRLRGLVNAWETLRREAHGGSEPLAQDLTQAEDVEGLGRQDAHLLAAKALLSRTHARLEHGLDAETETALVRVWLGGVGVALDEFEGRVRRRLEGTDRRDDRPLADPGAGPPVARYADYLAAPCPYDSGDFLGAPLDLLQPRLVPEMLEADPVLADYDRELRERFGEYFGPLRNGLRYERHVEKQHHPDPEDLDFCRRHGYFRMPIPEDLGGEGRPKVDYYLLITNAQRQADVALALTIQANTSIGTTPILLARDKDLPKAQKDLAPFVGDPALQQEVRAGLERLRKLLAQPDPKRARKAFVELNQRVQETVLARTVLRALAHRFVRAWQEAGKAGQDFDLPAMRARVEEALVSWNDASARAEDYHAELGRRREACDLFLRWIASGQISAFALTEPSAGSDTARVATRARPRFVPVEPEPTGVYRFVPAGGTEPRHLLDARRLDFRPEGVFYRWSDDADPAPVRFDEYDYATDAPEGRRYFERDGGRVHFTDVAQLRERDGRLWYDYWELTGAKMWITNGRMAGVMCLYTKTEEGVTGFLVDRHAEGLVVGKDEAKLGQCASPTNELSLQAVRVPRENVLGLEGRGQVNALETLNVGRAGLAVSAAAQMQGLIEHARAFARAAHGEVPDWVAWRLQQMEEIRFTAESLAWEVVGRFDHPQTRSVRMESAVSKMLVSELWHHLIELAEDVYGLAGQTERHLVEKRKRDARILNIYEGTNEVQRFLLLKDLATESAPRWSEKSAADLPGHLSREPLELEALKGAVRQRVRAALEVFGQEVWQNPNLQANCFLLSEAAAWVLAATTTLGRLAWLDRLAQGDEAAEPVPKIVLGRQALARCYAEVRLRLAHFDEELTHLRRGYYAPEIRAAGLLFDRAAERAPEPPPASRITQPLAVLVVVEPAAAPVPHPHVADGRLLEPYRTLREADRSALDAALRLRDQASAAVTVTVAAAGPRGTVPLLREALSLGVDQARLVLAEVEEATPDGTARALVSVLRAGPAFDLVLGGGGGSDFEEGLVARLVAAGLEVPHAGQAGELAVRKTDAEAEVVLRPRGDRPPLVRALPAAVAVDAGQALRPFTLPGYLAGLARAVQLDRWPKKVPASVRHYAAGDEAASAPSADVPPQPLAPTEAARLVLEAAGVGTAGLPPAAPFEGRVDDVASPTLPAGAVVAVVAADGDGRLRPTAAATLRVARLVAEAEATGAAVLVLVGASEAVQRRAVAQAAELGAARVVLLTTPSPATSADVQGRLLQESWGGWQAVPRAVVGEPWAEAAFAVIGQEGERGGSLALRVRRAALEDGRVVLESLRERGKLRARRWLVCEPGTTNWIGLTSEAEVVGEPAPGPAAEPQVERWAPRLQRLSAQDEMRRLLEEVKQEAGLTRLADADFIIDVGYGVGSRDGYEEVIEPLEKALRGLGVRNLAVGGSRKVTEELHLLPADRQIGQSGVRVNPQVLLAIGISGAPQHLDFIGPRATVLAFNRDAEAPLMTLNQRQARPRVFPIVGDLFETVPAFTEALRREQGATEGMPAVDRPRPAPAEVPPGA